MNLQTPPVELLKMRSKRIIQATIIKKFSKRTAKKMTKNTTLMESLRPRKASLRRLSTSSSASGRCFRAQLLVSSALSILI